MGMESGISGFGEWISVVSISKQSQFDGGDKRMIPDLNQPVKAENDGWTPSNNVPVVMFDRVSKSYGRINAATGISLGISGGVTGILGMNGAGKSTMFKLMMGKIRPSSGAIRLFGEDPWKNTAPYSRVGFVPEHEKLHDWMTGFDFVTTFARLHGLTRAEAEKEGQAHHGGSGQDGVVGEAFPEVGGGVNPGGFEEGSENDADGEI